jgi:membrane protein implicated in regulation of membrane protease activity
MANSSALSSDVQAELLRRHKSTATTVLSLLVAVILLSILAYVSQKFLTPRNSSSLDMTFRIIIPILGLGAIALRRTRLAKMRLQDIAALRGSSGLLATLQKTALLMAVIGIAVAIIGFVCTLMSGQVWYTFTAGVVAAAILLFYGYPLRPSWEQAVQRYSSSENSTNLVESES